MAGIKIHQYPLERTSIGDEDYYDIDYYTGSGYQSAKIKGSTLKNVLGANYIDISTFISGYELTDKDAGKLITNSNANVRTLVIPSGLALPNNMVSVKGRIAIQPAIGVNITLPNGSVITDPTQFTCEADEVYILHKSAFSGDNYILVSLKKSENIGTNDLVISDAVRELQVATDGTFQIVTNDANNSAIFKVGENNNERFGEIELNSVTFGQTIAEPNPTNNGAGIIIDVNPNEFGIEGRSDIGDSGTKRNRLYFSPNEVVFEKSNAGKLTFNSLGAGNTFEDLRATKKGIEYLADYSANFSLNSLIDKRYGLSIGLERVTTLQMNALPSPFSDKLVFNTDLKAIYRYDQPSLSWVALSAGYGIIGVYSGTGNGTPTFFATLQSALETCKASGGYFTVKLYSNLTITSAIEINYTGSGTGNAYQFRQLTIDFNGFSVTNAQANTSEGFNITLSNSISVYQEIRFLNGNVFRTNGTGTHRALKCDTASRYGTIQMDNMFWYCQNGIACSIDLLNTSTQTGINKVCDFANSTLVSQTSTALVTVNSKIRNFNAIAHGSTFAISCASGEIQNFTVENTSSGTALAMGGTAICKNFDAFSNSGTAVNITAGTLFNFTFNSVSGIGLNATTGTCNIDKFSGNTGNNYGVYVLGQGINISNGKVYNNSALDAVYLANFGTAHNIEGWNNGSGVGLLIGANQVARNEASSCKGFSVGGIGGILSVPDASATIDVSNCLFSSDLNTSGGHALTISSSTGTIRMVSTRLKVKNSGANAIHATGARTVNSRYCTHNDVASTPINANVTIVSSGIIS